MWVQNNNQEWRSRIIRIFVIAVMVWVVGLTVQLFDTRDVREVEAVNGLVLSVEEEPYELHTKGGVVTRSRWVAMVRMDDGRELRRIFDDTLVKGHPPVIDELIAFKKATFEQGSVGYVLDHEKWSERFLNGPVFSRDR
ncbi:hypothetical protein OLMES_1519 [Oleiphilus messinensis]|uniref:Uncharacterized protein n=1 Tax=Oleiphilus messinensis TaxID=141451 RepID=A0A1Y0I828_9GAMM|nr:hypothetical protein [Oleiphilus messinensis]ARU55594.1 hypothetical protein OLMES_1519 [Oleiphilus messinensis]